MKHVKGLALFDFDGTLCPGDSIMPYLRFCIREKLASPFQWLRAGSGYLLQKIMPGRVVRAKEWTLSFLAGRSQQEMDEIARRFWETELKPRFYADGLHEMQRLRDEGYTVWILSASADCYMRVACEYLPADRVFATHCVLDEKHIYTGKIAFNLRDEEKVRMLKKVQRECGLDELKVVYAFGDSCHDIPMLMTSEHPNMIHPGKKLKKKMPMANICLWK